MQTDVKIDRKATVFKTCSIIIQREKYVIGTEQRAQK